MEYILSTIGLPQDSLKRAFAPLEAFAAHIYDHFIPSSRNNYHPHILGQRALALFSGLLVVVKVFAIALLAFGPVAPAFSSAITVDNIISLTNQSRQQFNLPPLTENQLLDNAAQAKANDMLAKGYFAHVTPSGQTPWSFIVAAGYNYLMAGENLAVNFTEAENVETAWMNSPDHRANILNKNYQEIGIGISQGEYQNHEAIFVVQEFGVPADQSITLYDKPTPVQTTAVPLPQTKPVVQAVVPPLASALESTGGQSVQSGLLSAVADALGWQAQTLGANQPLPSAQAVIAQSGSIMLDGNNVDITAQVSGPVSKAIAYFGQQAIMLSPKDNTTWTGQVAASTLAQSNTTVHLEVFGMEGQTSQLQLADFSPSIQNNYNPTASAPTPYVTFLGHSFDPNSMANRFYLLFIAAILTCLILAIAIKRHIQHLPLIANASFVVILACMLWMGG
jgi:hypothetical protein